MKRFFALILVSCLSVLTSARADTLEDQYVHAFNLIQEADALGAADAKQALAKYSEAQDVLHRIQQANANWNPLVVNFRLEYVAGKLTELNSKATASPASAPTNVPPAKPEPATPSPSSPPPQTSVPAPTAVPAPAVEPQRAAAPDDWQEQISTLKDQVRQLQAERGNLQAKLKEAFAARPPEADPSEVARLQQRIQALQKENDLLKVTVDTQKGTNRAIAPVASPAQVSTQTAELNRQLAQEKELVARLSLEKEALQTRLKSLGSSNSPVAATENTADAQRIKQLESERDALQKQLDAANRGTVAHKSKSTDPRTAELQLLLDIANTKLAVYEAKAVPYTAQELALLKTSPGKLSNDSAVKPMRELSTAAAQLVAEARKAFGAGDIAKAESTYEQVLHEQPDSVPVLVDLAAIELRADHVEAAERHINEALKLAPDSAYALSTLGRLRIRQHRDGDALDALAQAVKLEPNNAEIQNFLGVALSNKGMRLQAENAFRKAVELEPNYADAHQNLALSYLSGNPPAVALARWHYQRALESGGAHSPELEKMLQASR